MLQRYRFGITIALTLIAVIVLIGGFLLNRQGTHVLSPSEIFDSLPSLDTKGAKSDVVSVSTERIGMLSIYLKDANSPDFLDLDLTNRSERADVLLYWVAELKQDIEKIRGSSPSFDRFTAASVSQDKEFIVFAVSKNRYHTSVQEQEEFRTVLGSIQATTGKVVINEPEEFNSEVSDIIWLEDNTSFVVTADSELAFCDIPKEFEKNTCHFKVTADDVTSGSVGPNFVPHFRDIRWENDSHEYLLFSTDINTWSTKVPGRKDWRISRSGEQLGSISEQDPIEYVESEKLGVEFGCNELEDAARCFNLVQAIFGLFVRIYEPPVTEEAFVRFFEENFPGLQNTQVSMFRHGEEIISGVTDTKYMDKLRTPTGNLKPWTIISFQSSLFGEKHMYVTWLLDSRTATFPPPMGIPSISGEIGELGGDVFFDNELLFLVQEEFPFFLADRRPTHGTCEPFQWSKVLYRFKGNQVVPFDTAWEQEYYRNGKFPGQAEIENTFTQIRFEDLDGDGNKEIIQEGGTTFCGGEGDACYNEDCTQITRSLETRKIFRWSPATKTFVEQG